jgi:peptide-methionine (S)-S-oxide reductase
VVKLTYDPAQVSLREMLEIFFVVHDPTRSTARATTSARSTAAASTTRTTRKSRWRRRDPRDRGQQDLQRAVVTEVAPLANYSTAEAYHQDYFLNNPNQGYCAFVVGPKVEKFQKTFASRVKA